MFQELEDLEDELKQALAEQAIAERKKENAQKNCPD
jgi:hypothetical protein